MKKEYKYRIEIVTPKEINFDQLDSIGTIIFRILKMMKNEPINITHIDRTPVKVKQGYRYQFSKHQLTKFKQKYIDLGYIWSYTKIPDLSVW